MILGKGQNEPRSFQSGESLQEKGFKLLMPNFRFQKSSNENVTSSVHVTGTTQHNGEEQHDIDHDLPTKKHITKKSVIPPTGLDHFKKQ